MRPPRPPWQLSLLLYAAGQFVVLTVIAMLFYPGGSVLSPATRGYGFAANTLSDLGTGRTWSGAANPISKTLFMVALGTLSAALVLSSSTWAAFARRASGSLVLGAAVQVLMVICATCFAGVAFTPWNVFPAAHGTFVNDAFLLLLGFIAILAYAEMRNPLTRRLATVNAAYLGAVAIYFVLCLTTVGLGAGIGFGTAAAGQKIIVYISMVNVALQVRGMGRILPQLPVVDVPGRDAVSEVH